MTYSTLPSLTLRGVENTLRQLINDLRTTAEARCHRHGVDGGTVATTAVGLLACIGIEMVAQRAFTGTKDDRIRAVFKEIATQSGCASYETFGFAVFKLVRNGVAHGFWPLEVTLPGGQKTTATLHYWIDATSHRSVCIDEIGPPAESEHFKPIVVGMDVMVKISALHLARDVEAYVNSFIARLIADPSLQQYVEQSDLALHSDTSKRFLKQLNETETEALSSLHSKLGRDVS